MNGVKYFYATIADRFLQYDAGKNFLERMNITQLEDTTSYPFGPIILNGNNNTILPDGSALFGSGTPFYKEIIASASQP